MATASAAIVPPKMKPTVVIADDHLLVLEGLKKTVEEECTIVGSAANGRDLVNSTVRLLPDLVLLDVTMPILNGIEAARQIRVQSPKTRLIFVTMQMSRDYIREAFEAGASGYVPKQAATEELVDAIRQVHRGDFFLSPTASQHFLGYQPAPIENPLLLFTALTSRQREVLQLVAEGRSAKDIASLLFISVKTVEFHKRRLMEELGLCSTAELIRYAVQNGWVAM